MNIYITTRVDIRGGMAAASRIRCLSKSILEEKVFVKVLITKQTKLPIASEREGIFEGIPYKYVGKKQNNRRSYNPLRYIDYLIDDYKLYHYLKNNIKEGDVILSYGCTIFHSFINILLAHKKKCLFFRDLCEYPFATTKERYLNKLQRYILFKYQFKLYDGVIAISDALVQISKQYCNKNCLIIKVPILVDFNNYSIEDKSNESSIPYIFHSGTLTEQKDGFVGMVEAFGKCCEKSQKPIRFISTGDLEKSPNKIQIKQLINKYNLYEKIIFTGFLTDDELKKYLQKASFVIINKSLNLQNTYCFSTKLGEYLAAGKAPIITRVGEAINWINDKVDSLIIEPDNTEILSDAILLLLEHPDLREKLGNNARITCKEKFDYRIWGKQIVLAINSKINRG